MRPMSLVVVLLLNALVVTPARAQAPQAWVVEVQPRSVSQPLAAGIVRGGGEQPVLLWQPLYAGDHLFARGSGAMLVIELSTQERVTLDPDHRREFTVEGDSNLLSALLPTLTNNMRWSNSAQLKNIQVPRDSIGRGDGKQPLTVLNSVRDPLKFSSSGGPLWVGWSGGQAPFKVVIETAGQDLAAMAVCDHIGSVDCVREATLSPAGNLPATFTMKITDATGAVVVRHGVVASGEAGSPGPNSSPRDVDQFSAIVAMVDRGGGRAWALEAARRLVPPQAKFPPARAMLDGLRDGLLP